MDLENVSSIDSLGEGTFSSSYRVMRKGEEEYIVIKAYKAEKISEEMEDLILERLTPLMKLSSENFLRLHDCYFLRNDEGTLFCVEMEYAKLGNLADLLQSQRIHNIQNTEHKKLAFCIQIAKGLSHFHAANLVHNNIRFNNVFVFPDSLLKLGEPDYHMVTGIKFLRKRYDDLNAKAPELLDPKRKPTMKTDLFSLGCFSFEIFIGRNPFAVMFSSNDLRKRIGKGIKLRTQEVLPEIQEIINSLLDADPGSRMPAEDAYKKLKVILSESYAHRGSPKRNTTKPKGVDNITESVTTTKRDIFDTLNNMYRNQPLRADRMEVKSIRASLERKPPPIPRIEHLPIDDTRRESKQHDQNVMPRRLQGLNGSNQLQIIDVTKRSKDDRLVHETFMSPRDKHQNANIFMSLRPRNDINGELPRLHHVSLELNSSSRRNEPRLNIMERNQSVVRKKSRSPDTLDLSVGKVSDMLAVARRRLNKDT